MASEAEQNIPDVDDVVSQLRLVHKQLVEANTTVWDAASKVIEASNDPQVVEDGIPLAQIDQDREKVLDVTTRGISRSDELISILDTLFKEVDVIDQAGDISPEEKKRRKMARLAAATEAFQANS
jgi:hypothetical protein